jgi:hypothetical protein
MKFNKIANRIAKIEIPKDTVIKFDKELFNTSYIALKNRNFKEGLNILGDGLQSIIDMMHQMSRYSDNEMNEAKLGRNTRKDMEDASLALTKAKDAIDQVKDNLGDES